ncbi:hypothetical protein NTE19_001891 [Vibrio fluvialis]|nr:hypothetical protein [Vibrio fluvialis]
MALPSLTTQDVRKIEALIGSWKTKLTWDLLVERIKVDFDISITRQSLRTYKSIKDVFDYKKQTLRSSSSPKDLVEELVKFSKADIDRFEQISRLESQNALLEKKLAKQLAFIKRLSELADATPALLEVFNKAKKSLSQKS